MAVSPENKNFLGGAGFKLVLDRIPHVTYFCQGAPIPSVSLSTIQMPSPVVTRQLPGTKVTFSPFEVTFKIDEDMKNFIEIFNWISGLGFPETNEQYRRLQQTSKNQIVTSDATLVILSSKYNPNLKVKFRDMYPTDLSQLNFTTQNSDVDYLEATTTFAYTTYTIELL